MRAIIDIPDDVVERLSELGARQRLARAEIIRRAIALYLKENERPREDEAFGLWKDRNIDGVDYQTRLREEWPR